MSGKREQRDTKQHGRAKVEQRSLMVAMIAEYTSSVYFLLFICF